MLECAVDLLTSGSRPLANVLWAQPLFQGSLDCSLLLWAEGNLGRRMHFKASLQAF